MNTRLIYAIAALAYPELFRGILGMWGQSIPFIIRTQEFSVYRGFRKRFAGVAKIGARPEPELQATIDAVANAFGWTLDKDNIQREVYSQRLSRHLVPTLLSEGTDKVKYFEGTPIPTSILLVAVLALAAWFGAVGQDLWLGEITLGGFTLHPLVLMFAVSGSLMISRFRIPKL